MTDGEPSLADLQALSANDLHSLVAELLAKGGRSPTPLGVDGPATLLVSEPSAAVVINRVGPRNTPLAGVSLTALRRQALAVEVADALVVTTGAYTVAQRADLERAIEMLDGVGFRVVEGPELLSWLVDRPAVRRSFFPTLTEAETAAADGNVSPGLVKFAARIVPREPATTPRGARATFVPLVTTLLILFILISLPLTVGPYCARLVGAIGLGVVILSIVGGYLLTRFFERPTGVWRGAPLKALLPVPDATTVLRGLTRGPGWSMKKFLAFLVVAIPIRIVALIARTSLMLFFVFFASALLLLWGIDPEACTVGDPPCEGAFAGAGSYPSVGDFFYLAVHAAVFSQPADLAPVSRVARGVITAEFVAAATLLVSYASALGLADLAPSVGGDRPEHNAPE